MSGALRMAPDPLAEVPRVTLFGVPIINATPAEAIAACARWIGARDGRSRSVYLVNAHTLNLACEDPAYHATLAAGDAVFGDGTGVRIAARWKGVAMRANLVGTDLLPEMFRTLGDPAVRYYLLGATADTVARAVERLRADFPGIDIVGFRDGYVPPADAGAAVAAINACRPDVLLVAMGNPLQEQWIHDHRAELRVPVCIGVGGLFDHWAGNLERAAPWVRRLGIEWLQILLQQPHKWRRYLLGNPKFLLRARRDARAA